MRKHPHNCTNLKQPNSPRQLPVIESGQIWNDISYGKTDLYIMHMDAEECGPEIERLKEKLFTLLHME